jgi:glycosyltransferase involved in cell wall biosynthesis
MIENNNIPLVSICCLTYNQETYIKQCLDGFIMQKTNFPFEVLIHDDASTDKTASIIREYETKYPDIIKPIYQTENQYSQHISPTRKFVFPRARGKYIALCEGDDYWTDPLKLQKQVDFLEANEDFSICFHNVTVKNETNNSEIFNKSNIPEISSIKDLALGMYIYTCSVVIKTDGIIEFCKYSKDCPVGDYLLFMLTAKYGKIKYISEIMGVYRIHAGGVWSSLSSIEKIKKDIQIKESLIKIFKSDKSVLKILLKSRRYLNLFLLKAYLEFFFKLILAPIMTEKQNKNK